MVTAVASPVRTPSPTLTAASQISPSLSTNSTLGSKRNSSFADFVSLKHLSSTVRIQKSSSVLGLSSLQNNLEPSAHLDLTLPQQQKTHHRSSKVFFAPMTPPSSTDSSPPSTDVTRLNSSSSFYRRQSMIIIDELEAKKAKHFDPKTSLRKTKSSELLPSSSGSQLATVTFEIDVPEIDRHSVSGTPEPFINSSTKSFSASSSIIDVEDSYIKPPVIKFFTGDYEEDDDDELPSPPRQLIPVNTYNSMFQDMENHHHKTLRRQSTSFASKVRFAMTVEEYSVQEWRDRWMTFRYLRALERSKISPPPEGVPPTLRRSVSLRDSPVSAKEGQDEGKIPRRESWAGRKSSKHRGRSVGLWTRARLMLHLKKSKKKDFETDRRSLDSLGSLELSDDEHVMITWPRSSPGVPQIKSPTVEEWITNEWEKLEGGWQDWCWFYPRLEGGIKWWNAWILFGKL